MLDETVMQLTELIGKKVQNIRVRTNKFTGEPIMVTIEFNDRALQIQHDPAGSGEDQGPLDVFPHAL